MRPSILVTSLAICVGCASANLSVVQPLQAPIREVSLDFKPGPAAPLTDEQGSRLRTSLTTALSEAGVNVHPGATAVDSLDGEIQRFNPGNRALRYFIGYGAGRGSFDSTWRVLDGTGQQVGACRVEGSIVMGVFGGSYDDVLEKVGARLGDFLLATP